MTERQRRRAYAAITTIVFVDGLGFALVLPFLPLYARRSFGASSLAVGALVATFAVCQLFSAPVIGRFSDRAGRRPALLVTLCGSCLGFLTMASAQVVSDHLAAVGFAYASTVGLALLFLGRAINGAAGGNLPVAQAYLTDITAAEARAHAMGAVTTALVLAFGVGPLIAGYLSQGDSFSLPCLVGALASATAAAICWLLLPESRAETAAPPRRRLHAPEGWRAAARRNVARIGFRHTHGRVRWLLIQWFLFILCFAMTAPMFPLIGGEYLGLTTVDIGRLLALMAVLAIVWQVFILKRLSARLSDGWLAAFGIGSFLASFLLVFRLGAAEIEVSKLAVTGVIVLFGLGFGASRPAIASALTKTVPDAEVGAILGRAQSVDSAATIVGPILAGILLQGSSLRIFAGVAATFSVLALVSGWAATRRT